MPNDAEEQEIQEDDEEVGRKREAIRKNYKNKKFNKEVEKIKKLDQMEGKKKKQKNFTGSKQNSRINHDDIIAEETFDDDDANIEIRK